MKMIKTKCETCWSFIDNECRDIDKDFCLESSCLIFWMPKNESYCLDCPMHYTNNESKSQCARHAEPCFKNSLDSDMSKWRKFKKECEKRRKLK